MDEKEVTELLKSAVSAVNASGAKGELREPAFNAAFSLLTDGVRPAPKQGKSAAPLAQASTQAASPPQGSAGSSVLDRIAVAVKIDASRLLYVYTDKNGEPELSIKSSKLPATKSAGARDIALLLMAARQGAEIEEYTEADTIRSACKRFGKFDKANFGKAMAALDNHVITEGKGVSIRRRLTHPGLEEATELIEKYAAQG
jgi:hypothetical protein